MAERARRSGISRITQYFREVDFDEAEVVLQLCSKIVSNRRSVPAEPTPAPKVKRTRRRKHAGEPAPHARTDEQGELFDTASA